MGIPIRQVDAFADRPFTGNPAAVCVLDTPAEEGWMQAVAAEMNLAETAFLHREADGWRLRWFTPAVEVPLCGHATLASTHVLYEDGHLQPHEVARFHTLSGLLTARRTAGGIALDFPLRPVTPAAAPPGLLAALGVTPVAVSANEGMILVELAEAADVRALKPDFGPLASIPKGIIVTSRSDLPEFDFISRMFAPGIGIPEDPVTGAAHCSLAPYWRAKLGKDTFRAYQASARGGALGVQIVGERVILTGQAITVLRGELLDASGA
jgi:PhzF family phenazine biosynthesis protein